MNLRTSRTVALLAASMLAGTYYAESFSRRARGERMYPSTPTTAREKQAKNRYRREKRRGAK